MKAAAHMGESISSVLPDWISLLELKDDTVSHDENLEVIIHQMGSPLPCEILKEDGTENNRGSCHQEAIQGSHACVICNLIDVQRKASLVASHMGNMAQCRGARGDMLRESGAICALLNILWRLSLPLQRWNQWIPQNYQSGQSERMPTGCEIPSLLPSTCWAETINSIFKSHCVNHAELRINHPFSDSIALSALYSAALDLTNLCLGALRDLSCGSSLNRSAILEWTPPSVICFHYKSNGNKCLAVENGVQLLCAYMLRYHTLNWTDILTLRELSCTPIDNITKLTPQQTQKEDNCCFKTTDRGKKELRLLTNTLGAIRNTSHSTPDNCQAFYESGLVEMLVWRLSPELHYATVENGEKVSPPHIISSTSTTSDVTRHWREAKYRAAGSLINLAEKCPSVAKQLGSNREMILLLIEAWGGVNAITVDSNNLRGIPLLHIGLAAILHAAKDGALKGGLDDVMVRILEKEQTRKKVAKRKEAERQSRLNKLKTNTS
ncbi:hypothetical protein HJC23_007219 [Cyclotella cryptica]|uniref:Ataxin-10 domain-containing protein n=1 Tax=Cyclotella cryptica TaxID=29204 RepID=A0ABD3QQY0_9STRA|eukprot:CCRYP_003518-RB/>CCRYP_003518-RB protein AED:0.01 eAED:0.01 QI:76/-1/1/1/-1/1/1/98/494